MTTNTREEEKQYKISQENASRVVKKGGDEAKGAEESGLSDEGTGRAGQRLQECLERRRTGPQQYTTKLGAGWGVKKRKDEI